MDPKPITTDPQGPPPGAIATPIAQQSSDPQGPPPGAIATPIAPSPPVQDLTANPGGQGVYHMHGAKGMAGIPYDNVEKAQQQGYVFADSHESDRYGDDMQADPNRPRDIAENFGRGFAGAARAHLGGVIDLARKVTNEMGLYSAAADYQRKNPGATHEDALAAAEGKDGKPYMSDSMQKRDAEMKKTADWFKTNNETDGVGGWLGSAGENIGELMGPMELMKLAGAPAVVGDAATAADKMQAGAKVAGVLKNHPVISKLVTLGLHTLRAAGEAGAVTGAQTYVDTGGDTDAALHSGEIGAATGGVLSGSFEGLQAAREAYAGRAAAASKGLTDYQTSMSNYRQQVADRATKTDAANTDWQAAQAKQNAEHAQAMETHSTALTQRAADMEKARVEWKGKLAQQAQAHATATDAYNQQVSDRTAAQTQARAAWKAQLDEQATKHAADVAEYQKSLADHNQTVGSLKNEAATALKTQRQIDAQQGITNTAKNAAQDAITRFNEAGSPGLSITGEPLSEANFEPADPAEAAKGVSSFGDTAEAIRAAAQPVYDRIDEVTNGNFGKLQKARSQAIRTQDFTAAGKAEQDIDTLLDKNPGVSPAEYRAAKSAWHDSKDMDRIHGAVEGAFNGISPEMAAQPGTSARILKGGNSDAGALQMRLGGLLRGPKALTEERISQLIGPDGLAGLYRASHMVSTPELRAATQQLAEEIGSRLPPPTAPVKPEAPAAPAPIPKPTAPVKPEAVAAPTPIPKPTAPVKPAPIPKPEPLPRPERPTKPDSLPKKPTLVGELGKSSATAAVGGLIGPHVGLSATQGAEAAVATRFVLRQMVTNPKVGMMMNYAVEHGADPVSTARIIATMISKSQNDQPAQGEAQ